MTMGQKIRAARKTKGMTQKELASKIGAKHNSISNWENDQNSPDPNTIQNLCWALDVQPNYFFEDQAESAQPSADELAEYLQAVHDNPKLGVLFKRGRNATPEKLDAILALLGSDEDEQY